MSNNGSRQGTDNVFSRLTFFLPCRRSRWGGYAFALAMTLLAFVIRKAIAPDDGGIQYVTFFPAVALAAVVGGFGPGMLAAVLGALLASWFFWAPYGSFVFDFSSRMVVLSNTVYLVDALLVCSAIEAMHRYYLRYVDAEQSLKLAASVFENAADGIMVTDERGVIQAVNPAFTEITGYTRDEAIGNRPGMLRSDHQDPEFYEGMWASLVTEGRWQGELWNRRKGGEAYLERLTINRVVDGARAPVRYVGVFNDITELRRKDDHIRHLAFHDALTGLPNRALFLDRLEHALQRGRREGLRLVVIFIDLDRFKAVNDGLGHAVGDLLLQQVAARIQGRLRQSDTVARLGGDEFVVLMEGIGGAEDCVNVADDLIAEVSRPMELRGHAVQVGASLGLAFFPEDGLDADELMKRADVAMYAAKEAGRNTYRFFQQQMLDAASRSLLLEGELRRTIAGEGLTLYYQPKILLATGEVLGAEALVRWRHPERGLIPPAEFIPLAEQSGLIVALGDWVLSEVCRQQAQWRAEGRRLKIAFNLSARELEHDSLPGRIAELVALHAIPAESLEVEVTESMVMTDPQKASGVLQRLRQLGVTVAIDDFGTGYSSLAYLRRLPIDVLKVDRSFVMDADTNDEDAQIVRTIVGLAQSLKLIVVAEGIETQSQAELLRGIGCHRGQGYLFAKPMPPAEFEAWLAAGHIRGADTA